jgi:phosphoglycerate kinase
MHNIDLTGKRILIREDLNVPIINGKIISDARILAILPTLRLAIESQCTILIMSHMGRPIEGRFDSELSLKPIAKHLSNLVSKNVQFIANWRDGVDIPQGSIALLENVRFEIGEKKNDDLLAKQMAKLCDIFVMDAFACSHRAHASTCGIIKYAKLSCAGPLLSKELESLELSFRQPEKPVIAIVGGSKVSTKLEVIKSLAGRVDYLILGGGIANTFIKAAGNKIGYSLHEDSMLDVARMIQSNAKGNCEIPEIEDVIVAKNFHANAEAISKSINDIEDDDLILDIGPITAGNYSKIIGKANTIIWNGPLGVFEFNQFGSGTRKIAKAIAASNAFSAAGGGDTLAAIEKYQITDNISYISTGGGAFLEYIEGKTLPSVAALQSIKQ